MACIDVPMTKDGKAMDVKAMEAVIPVDVIV